MEELAPSGPVFQAGTLSGNPLASAAALVVLRRLRDAELYERLERSATELETGVRAAAAGQAVCLQRVGSMLTLFFREGAVRNLDEAKASDLARYGAFFRHLLARGVYLPPSQFEAMFVATVHGAVEVDRTVEAAADFFS
jgi:glutamate-1-semialdehyde 2,1-aminomutase